METDTDFRAKFIKLAMIMVTLIATLSMVGMIAYASNKTIVITGEDIEDETDFVIGSQSFSTALDIKSIKKDSSASAAVIYCPSMPTQDSVMVASRYGEKKVYLVWKDGHDDYFLNNSPAGTMSHVKGLKISGNGTEVFFTFDLDCMAEPVVTLDDRSIRVDFLPIVKDEVVVAIDPAFGGSQNGVIVGDLVEKDIVLAIAKSIRKRTKGEGYRVVLLRDGDYAMSQADRIKTLEYIGADYYISLHLGADTEDERKYGMYAEYNGTYYREEFANVTFADELLTCVCESSKDKGIALNDVTGDGILSKLTIPAANLYLGFLSNKDEGELLARSDYRDRIAAGVIEALDRIVE